MKDNDWIQISKKKQIPSQSHSWFSCYFPTWIARPGSSAPTILCFQLSQIPRRQNDKRQAISSVCHFHLQRFAKQHGPEIIKAQRFFHDKPFRVAWRSPWQDRWLRYSKRQHGLRLRPSDQGTLDPKIDHWRLNHEGIEMLFKVRIAVNTFPVRCCNWRLFIGML